MKSVLLLCLLAISVAQSDLRDSGFGDQNNDDGKTTQGDSSNDSNRNGILHESTDDDDDQAATDPSPVDIAANANNDVQECPSLPTAAPIKSSRRLQCMCTSPDDGSDDCNDDGGRRRLLQPRRLCDCPKDPNGDISTDDDGVEACTDRPLAGLLGNQLRNLTTCVSAAHLCNSETMVGNKAESVTPIPLRCFLAATCPQTCRASCTLTSNKKSGGSSDADVIVAASVGGVAALGAIAFVGIRLYQNAQQKKHAESELGYMLQRDSNAL